MNDTVLPYRKENAANDAINEFIQSHDINVAAAVISGSHVRGTSTRKSGVDIRAVHVQTDLTKYITYSDANDTITEHYKKDLDTDADDDEINTITIDVESWDVRKFAELLLNSNHQAIEVIQTDEVLLDHPAREELRRHIIEENNVDLSSLYNNYVTHAKNNYQTYLSDHLVSNTNTIYPINERTSDGYLVDPPNDAEDEFYIPEYTVDLHKNGNAKEPITVPQRITTTDSEGSDSVERHFRTTMTEQTIKRNVAVIELCLKARFIANMESIPSINTRNVTNEEKKIELQEILELEDDDFNAYDSIDKITSLLNESQNKHKTVGNIVKEENILPPIKQNDLPAETPETDVINKAIKNIVPTSSSHE